MLRPTLWLYIGTAGWMASEVLIGIRDQTRVKYRPSCDIQVSVTVPVYSTVVPQNAPVLHTT